MAYIPPNPNGQATMANSEPVVIASNQTAIPITDNSGSLTVDGTVAATQSGTWTVQPGNTANTTAWKVDGSAVTQPVSGSVTANAGTNLNTSALALESGGNLATIASAVKAEDAASADGDKGVPLLAVRKATPANTSGTDGDYENLQVSAGRLWVDASGKTLTVDGSATTQPVSGTVNAAQSGTWSVGSSSATGSATPANAFLMGGTDGTNLVGIRMATTALNAASGILATANVAQFDDASPTMITENQFGNARMSANRNMYQTIRDAAGNERGVNVNASNQMSVSADNVVPGTGATNLGKAEDAAHTTGDTGIYALGVRQDADTSPVSADGDYHGLVFNAVGRLKTSALPAATSATTGNITTNTGTVTVDTTRQSGVTMQIIGTFSAFNGTFEGSIDGGTTWNAIQAVRSNSSTVELATGLLSANPGYFWKISSNNFTTVRIRATALTSGTVAVTFLPTAFSSDPAPASQRTRRDLKVTQQTTITSSTTETTVLTAVAATFLDVYGVIVANTSASAVDVTFKDATAGTTRFNVYVPAGETRGFMLPPDGAHPQNAVNTNWTATCGTSVASVKITVMAVKNT